MSASDRITLYYREGASDKVYQAAIEPAGDLFTVNYAYGRRGSTLTTGTKTTTPVAYDEAQKIFTKLVKEKQNKGYTEGEDGTPYAHSEKTTSGVLPQLLNPTEEIEVDRLLHDDEYCAQEKFDGRHLLARRQAAGIEGINKKGLIVGLPQTMLTDLAHLPQQFVSDGECVGEVYHIFDLLEMNGQDLRSKRYDERLWRLMNLSFDTPQKHVRCVATAFSTADKLRLWQRLRAENREGIVFKQLSAPYTPGKPNRGGAQLKFKFVATLSAIVAQVNRQRSVEISLFKGRSLVSCGNVTIPVNHDIPRVGMIVEVRYLYAFPESGILYQPVYLGQRDDVAAGECVAGQLKFKAD